MGTETHFWGTLEPSPNSHARQGKEGCTFPCSPLDWTRARERIWIICHGRQFYCEAKFGGFLLEAPSVMFRRKRSALRGRCESFPFLFMIFLNDVSPNSWGQTF
ncbi:hypothetical protein CEXT_396701 [Caerostris extrusa]|uniref:Uncharacterized protein n=1 Tax=Caerostris extrusa TaxID=172846 RepID=A0AAV4T8V5_CAEEX|nr:hypothetical protein CEXT_396701 [Caerostris extrusa]